MSKNRNLYKNILVLHAEPEETSFLKSLSSDMGSFYTATNVEKAIAILSSTNINLLIVDSSMGGYSRLRGLFKPYTSIVIVGGKRKELKRIAETWPFERFVDIAPAAEAKADSQGLKRLLETAMRHSLLLQEVKDLRLSSEKSDIELQEAFHQIREVKGVIEKSVVKELEKRIAAESKYAGIRRQQRKIETILKKLYQNINVTNLIDIVHDIKDLIFASGISLYLTDESKDMGKCLIPVVWDNSNISHTELARHKVPLDFGDFAAASALQNKGIRAVNLDGDERLSSRYKDHLKAPPLSILCVPLKKDSEVVGIIEAYNKNLDGRPCAKGFTSEDLKIMEQICEYLAVCIDKLNLIQYDALTGLLLPDPFFEKIMQKLQTQTKRNKEEDRFALVLGGVNLFKQYNDRNGCEMGNKLLRKLAEILKSSTRGSDILCRYGNEEFLFFLSYANSKQETMMFINRIHKKIENYYFENQEFQPNGNITMNFGVTHLTRDRFPELDKITKDDLISVVNEAEKDQARFRDKLKSEQFPDEITEDVSEKDEIKVYQQRTSGDKAFSEETGAMQILPPPLPKIVVEKLSPKSEDKRKYKRYDANTYFVYKSGARRKEIRTINISLGGVKILSEINFERGQSFELSLVMGKTVLECKGDVVYSQPSEAKKGFFVSGIKFRDLSFNDWKILEKYFVDLPVKEDPAP